MVYSTAMLNVYEVGYDSTCKCVHKLETAFFFSWKGTVLNEEII